MMKAKVNSSLSHHYPSLSSAVALDFPEDAWFDGEPSSAAGVFHHFAVFFFCMPAKHLGHNDP